MELNLCSSPIQRLPVELLIAIFVRASGAIKLSFKKEDIPATVLLLVSRQWHDIALATPLLWSSLDLDLECCHSNDEQVQRWTRLVSAILHRSSPLSLSLVLKDIVFESHNNGTLPIHEQLILHCHRWKNLSLYSKHELVKHSVFAHARGALESLQSLTLDCMDWTENQSVTVFESCPSLRHLFTNRLMPGDIEIPWHQLTSWISRAPMFAFTVGILSRCHSLTTLILEELRDGTETPIQVRVLTHIGQLSLHSAERNLPFTYILDALKAPLLTTLALETERHGHRLIISQIIPHIEQFLSHSACHLTSFSAKNLPFRDTDIISVLRLVPTVSTLILHEDPGSPYCMTNQTFLKRLRVQAGTDDDNETDFDHPLLPRLTALELGTFGEGDDWCSTLAEAVLSRWTSDRADIARLKSLRVCAIPSGAFAAADVFDQLVALRNDGFEFVLS